MHITKKNAATLSNGTFIQTLVNDGIDKLPDNEKSALLEWVHKKKLVGNKGPADPERRYFMKISTKLLLGGACYAAVDIRDSPVQAAGETTTTAGLVGAVLLAERKALECDALFREILPKWLKEKHDIDFSFPTAKRVSATHR